MAERAILTDADILTEIIMPDFPDLNPEAARAILALKFPPPAATRIRRLLRKNNQGTISAEERVALEKYLRVGQLLDLLHAKAKQSLGRNRGAP